MSFVSVAAVLSFEAIGAVLVVAFMVIPPATAYLLSQSMKQLLSLTVVVGLCMSISGYYVALWLDASVSGAMAACGGLLFGLVFIGQRMAGKLRYRLQNDVKKP